ncbi:MAG: non-heme iron oxygenase ferredoxin subunit [Leptospiraceae bacterium]|nr:non-heme iron oxygenase ferredoxin subunit [Leptospiraceae bacterium]MCB1314879.1 non-heme iron oxygenase ferredoxin subunit [Leptospiraceae bacterium]MCB1320059.1 non-heme iron oxygenase ferredoxin subunit [Leptospiraceae bacterium]
MSFIKVAKTSDVSENRMTCVNTRHGRIALTRIGDELFAFENTCTHDDGSLDGGEIQGETVSCPRHGALFNIRTGAVERMPATEPIEVFEVRVSGEDIEIKID